MIDEELARELERYADELVGGPVLKGLPRTRRHPGDGKNEEHEVGRLVLTHLGHEGYSLKSEPWGTGTIPDLEAVLANGTRIGIEVTEVVDQEIRHKRKKRRDAERKAKRPGEEGKVGYTQSEAFKCELEGKNPTPEYISRFATADWSAERLRDELERTVSKKDRKAEAHRKNGVDLSCYTELILAIFTGEEVTSDIVAAAKGYGPFQPRHFHRIIVVMDYEPQIQDWPIMMF